MKGFSTFFVISWAFSITSAIPTALKSLTIISLSAFKWWYKSTIYLACKDFITEKRRETFTSAGAMPFFNSLTIILGAKFCQIIVALPLKRISFYQQHLLFLGTSYFLWSDLDMERLLQNASSLQLIWPVFSVYVACKLRGNSTFGKHFLVLPK